MIEIEFLGTSASAPSVRRGLSSAMVLHRNKRFLVDCGEGTQRQLLKSGLGFKRLHSILLTHGHLDHILGLAGLISTFARWEAIDSVDVYGGVWALERVSALMTVVFGPGEPEYKLAYHQIQTGTIISTDELTVTAFPVKHRGPGCFGYLFAETPKRPFLPDKAAALGVPPGPVRADLVRGQSATLADGRIVTPDEVLGPVKSGARLAYVGDAGSVNDLLRYVAGADILVIESTYTAVEEEMANRFGHLTAKQAAWLAKEAGVRQLVLTHISRRYNDAEVLEEASAIFPDVVVAKDFDYFRVTTPE